MAMGGLEYGAQPEVEAICGMSLGTLGLGLKPLEQVGTSLRGPAPSSTGGWTPLAGFGRPA
ncbi:hypothetical protein B0A49_09066, partial [Cryomyces minteri]